MARKDPNAIQFDVPKKLISELVETYTSNDRKMKTLAWDMLDQIRTRTRLGFGVTRTGKKVRLKRLSNSYKDQRKGKVRFFTSKSGHVYPIKANRAVLSNKELDSLRASVGARASSKANRKINASITKNLLKPTHLNKEHTTPSKSNLTSTGSMLNSLTRRVINKRIFITLKNNRSTDMYGKPSKMTANKKAKLQAKAGRRFLDLAKFEQKLFRDRITKDLFKLSNRILSKLNKLNKLNGG